jgi:RNA polymerase sigma factor (sigma-70 family)
VCFRALAFFRSEIARDFHYNLDMQARADRELIEASRRGDRAAFAEIIERYQRPVYAVAFSGVRDRTRADDVAQDAFLIAWRRLAELRDPDRLPAWLCGIARNLARDTRKRLRRETLADDADSGVDPTTPYDAITEAETERTIVTALGQVPDVYREPLVLYYYEDRSVEDVARSLGITAATTNKRLSRGRRYLAERVALIVERGLARRGPSPVLAASVLALIAVTVPASRVDASTPRKGSTMHKLAIAATITAAVGAGTAGVVTATRSSDAQASSHTQPSSDPAAPAHGGGMHAMHGRSGALPPIAELFKAATHGKRADRTAAFAGAPHDCATVGRHLADLEAGPDPVRCAADYTSVCESEGWSDKRRLCTLASDDMVNAHLCSVATDAPPPTEIPAALACSVIAPHVAPIVQNAGMYADVPDFAQQIESACDTGEWSIALRQCFASGQTLEELHACMQPPS